MDNKEFSKELEKRTRKFAVRAIRLSTTLPNTPEGRVVRNQITKSGTSIGANYRESNRARSKPDFKNKIKICESEASETQYWIEVIVETKWLSWGNVKSDYEECSELLAIFTSIGKKRNHITLTLVTLVHFTL
jgi:four helix bundle protein